MASTWETPRPWAMQVFRRIQAARGQPNPLDGSIPRTIPYEALTLEHAGFDVVVGRIQDQQIALQCAWFEPRRVILGTRAYTALVSDSTQRYRDWLNAPRPFDPGIEAPNPHEILKILGMEVICDPFADPDTVHVLPGQNRDAWIYADKIGEALESRSGAGKDERHPK